MPVKIFFCYAREDEALLLRLKAHLCPLQCDGLIDIWSDREISAGSVWEQEIKRHLEAANIILFLISPHFMASDYCYSVEMQQALARHARGEVRIVPIILRPVIWQIRMLRGLQVLPTDGKPVTSRDWDEDSALYNVAKGIYQMVEAFNRGQASEKEEIDDYRYFDESEGARGNHVSRQREWHEKPFLLSHSLRGHAGKVNRVALSPDGHILASAGSDHHIRIWDLSAGELLCTLVGHTHNVNSVVMSPNGRTLISGGFDNQIKIWDLSTGLIVSTLKGHSGYVKCLAMSANGSRLISGGFDNQIKIWDLATHQEVQTLNGSSGTFSIIHAVAICPDGQRAVSGSSDRQITVWDLPTGRVWRTLSGHLNIINDLAMGFDGQRVLSGSSDNTIKMWDIPGGQVLSTWKAHQEFLGGVTSVALCEHSQIAVSGGYDHHVNVWRISTDRALCVLRDHKSIVKSVAISSDGQIIASGDAQGIINIWRM